jgi:hypothetical protein
MEGSNPELDAKLAELERELEVSLNVPYCVWVLSLACVRRPTRQKKLQTKV